MEKAKNFYESEDYFYALQQIDLAIKNNPIWAFGRPPTSKSIYFMFEDEETLRKITHTPSDYAIAYYEKGKLYSSQGRLIEGIREYQKAMREDKDFLESYYGLWQLMQLVPDRANEGKKHLDYLISSKRILLRRLVERGLPSQIVLYLAIFMENYINSLQIKGMILQKVKRTTDIIPYFKMDRL